MKSEEIFAKFPQVPEALAELKQHRRDAYRATVEALATRRKLRPVFIEKKPGPERNRWMAAEMAKSSNAEVATEVLYSWLMTCHSPMIVGFLDALEVKHNGQGLLDALPAEPARERVVAAVEALLAANPSWVVAIYLNLFCNMDIADWSILREMVATDARLLSGGGQTAQPSESI